MAVGQVDLAKLETQITEEPSSPPVEVSRFAPSKYRDNAATLESIQGDIRKTIDDLDKHTMRLDEYRQNLKATVDAMRRACA